MQKLKHYLILASLLKIKKLQTKLEGFFIPKISQNSQMSERGQLYCTNLVSDNTFWLF